MIPKKNRVDKKNIEKIFKSRNFLNTSNFSFRFIIDHNSKLPRISVFVPKNIAKLAVKRNFLKRRTFNILKKYLDKFPTKIIGIFIFKKYEDNVLIIENNVKEIVNKIN